MNLDKSIRSDAKKRPGLRHSITPSPGSIGKMKLSHGQSKLTLSYGRKCLALERKLTKNGKFVISRLIELSISTTSLCSLMASMIRRSPKSRRSSWRHRRAEPSRKEGVQVRLAAKLELLRDSEVQPPGVDERCPWTGALRRALGKSVHLASSDHISVYTGCNARDILASN